MNQFQLVYEGGGKKLWPNADHIEPEDNRYSAEVKIWDRQNPKQQGLLVV